jgi:hypothetical protein
MAIAHLTLWVRCAKNMLRIIKWKNIKINQNDMLKKKCMRNSDISSHPRIETSLCLNWEKLFSLLQ